jgi:serine/threonine protein kinase
MSTPVIPAESEPRTRVLRAGLSAEQNVAPDHGPAAASVGIESSRLPTVADLNRDDLTGFGIESYELGKKIGGGGMGAVFFARHVHLGRTFAIKFVAAAMNDSPEAQQRFEQETRALGRLVHPRIVNAVDAGVLGGLRYLVTEYVEGSDFQKLVAKQGPLPWQRACRLIADAAEGLDHAHAAGFVHRDIKPSNLILDRLGEVTILDFGLVRDAGEASDLTADNAVLGTWDYIAPEQAEESSSADARSDIYSLGGTLLYLLSGAPPFSGAKYRQGAAKLKGHLLKTPAWLESPPAHIPRDLVAVVGRMLAKSPEERFQTARDVSAALAAFSEKPRHAHENPRGLTPVNRRWEGAGIAGVAVVASLGLAGWICAPYALGTDATSPVGSVQDDVTPASDTPDQPAAPASEAETTAVMRPVHRPAIESPLPRPDRSSRRVTVTPGRTNSALPISLSPHAAVSREALGQFAPRSLESTATESTATESTAPEPTPAD